MYVILALLLLGVLIIAHEAGHFWAARACGISVQEFSMGMGPLIAKWKSRKGTQFSIRLLPIGGYCQFYGEDEEKDRRGNIRFLRRYVPRMQLRAFSKLAHAELVIVHPEEFCRSAEALIHPAENDTARAVFRVSLRNGTGYRSAPKICGRYAP